MQEAMLAIVRGLERFDGRAAFTTWSYRVATNACLDELRRRSRRPDPGLPDYEQADDTYVGGSAPRDPGETVSAQIDVDTGLAALPEEFRAPVVLRDIAGLDYADIADLLNLAPGTVRSRIARGRARLADALTGNQTDPDERQSL
jgi:RNA polymerase sigma-70 factor (ECF subfamily)